MRPLTARAPALPSLTRALVLGALFWPDYAAAECAWNGPTNVIALTGSVCQVSESVSIVAGPNPPGGQFGTGVPYTGFAVIAFGGGVITVTGSNVSITSAANTTGAYGVYSLGTSSLVTFSNPTSAVTVTTTGAKAFGLYAAGGGTIASTAPIAVTTSGNGASGVVAGLAGYTPGGVTSDASALRVRVTGDGSTGTTSSPDAPSETGGIVILSGGSVTTNGAGSPGLYASGLGSSITANLLAGVGAAVATNGSDSPGAQADSGGRVAMDGGSIMTGGAGSIGLYASRGGVLDASGTTMVTTSGGVSAATGLGAYGVDADGAGSAVNLASAIIKTSGAGAYGLLASDAANSGAAGSITATGPLSVQTANPAAVAVGLQGSGASILATGGGTIAAAGGAIAFLGGTNQTATFDNFTIASQSGDLIFADPSVATVNFNGTTANAGTNNLLDVVGGSFVTLNAAASTLTGAIKTDAASTSTVNLTNGSAWMMTGSSVVSNLAVSASYVVFAPPTAGGGFKTLTLGNYVGSGGFVTVNAVLGGTGAGSDQIIINGGKATGSTLLTIRNIGGGGGQTLGAGIPVIVAVNGGTIAPNAFALANTPVAGGYRYTLEETGGNLYLISAPTTTQAQVASSVTSIARAQQQQIITGRVLGSLLLGATEQVSCSNCGSGFGSIGSYAIGAHGRTSLTPELTVMGGFSYNEYSAEGITVTNAPTFAGALIYDPTNFGRSRPFIEIGGGVVPFEQVHYSRTYPYGAQIANGEANAIDRSLGLFGRVGWVDRLTPVDEAAVYTDISRSWLVAGGYTEASNGNNPFPATVSTGLQALDVLRFGGQYTHLFAGRYEVNAGAAVAYGFNETSGSQWNIADFGLVAPYSIGNSVWCEWGARVGYRFSQRVVVDAFLLGTLGGEIGTTVHGGIGLRYLF